MTLPDFITLIFLLVIASYYFLLLYRPKKREHRDTFAGITIIIPAHNEELLLADAIESVLAASFHGRKEVIVVDDGSSDETYRVAQQFSKRGVNAIRTCHLGKSAAINAALKLADTELIAIVDADSIIGKNALRAMAQEVGKRGVAAATGVVRVRNRKAGICMWVHIEQLYNSLMRLILAKANANIATPGPLSMYRKAMLDEIGGFSTDGFSEDLDVTIRLIRKGHHIGFSQDSIAETV
ncbi:TPA: glycosyltransferase family 2 protein, partial [Candidatus Woesearchaeota archaeon]|nr:glycosyltransferase family 2 protein [Candidatus Woesearchaeota archaeon]